MFTHDSCVYSCTQDGHTALMHAVKQQNKDQVEMLLKKGADPTTRANVSACEDASASA